MFESYKSIKKINQETNKLPIKNIIKKQTNISIKKINQDNTPKPRKAHELQ